MGWGGVGWAVRQGGTVKGWWCGVTWRDKVGGQIGWGHNEVVPRASRRRVRICGTG